MLSLLTSPICWTFLPWVVEMEGVVVVIRHGVLSLLARAGLESPRELALRPGERLLLPRICDLGMRRDVQLGRGVGGDRALAHARVGEQVRVVDDLA